MTRAKAGLRLSIEPPNPSRESPMNSGLVAAALVASFFAGVAGAAQPQVAETMMAAPHDYASRILRQIGETGAELRLADEALAAGRRRREELTLAYEANKSSANQTALENARVAESTALENYAQAKFQHDALSVVESALAEASRWRFHRRPRGVLVAVPVARNLGALEKYDGEKAVINIVHRLIQQDDLVGRVEVVFIEPAAFECLGRQAPPCCLPAAVVACGCR